METKQTTPTPYDEVMDIIFERLQPQVQEILLLAAIPHILDGELAKLLFPENTENCLSTIRSFGFASELQTGQIEYHSLARRYLLNLWMTKEPDRFRQVSNLLAQEFRRRLDASQTDATLHASEWLFHNLAFDPAGGIRLIANLFDELVESRELGSAERLFQLVEEQRPWLGEQSSWLDYFEAALAHSHYKEINRATLERTSAEHKDTLLAACCLRLLGRNSVRIQRWLDGRDFLLQAVEVCELVGDTYYQALAYMDLGDLFQNLVENSGGVLVEAREYKTPISIIYYALSRGPLWIYRMLAERINWLPNLYSMNYQNWVALHLLRLALKNYRLAEERFKGIRNRRGQTEVNSRMAGALFVLSYTASAERLCKASLKENIVQTSPYYTARFESILGQAGIQHKRFSTACENLSKSLMIFERYGDWESAARIAQYFGEACEKEGKPELALDAYRRCLEAARNSRNGLRQTEIAYRLNKLAQNDALSSSLRQKALDLRKTITSLFFIDRYTGPIQKAFSNLNKYLAAPFIMVLLLFTVAISFGAFLSVSFVAGEAHVPYSDPDVWWLQTVFLSAWIALPLLLLWVYNLTYVLLGQLVVLSLKFTKVDEAQPNLFVLDDQGISQQSQTDGFGKKMSWENIQAATINDRALYSRPMIFSSSVSIRDNETSLLLPASTFRYLELENEVAHRLVKQPPTRFIRNTLSILHWSSLTAALVFGVLIAAIVVIPQGLHSCYGIVPGPPDYICPEANRLYYLPIIPFGIFFASAIFGIISLVRWLAANRRAKKEGVNTQKNS